MTEEKKKAADRMALHSRLFHAWGPEEAWPIQWGDIVAGADEWLRDGATVDQMYSFVMEGVLAMKARKDIEAGQIRPDGKSRMRPRRNKKIPRLPMGAEMIACTYGVGKDDYIGTILAFIPRADGDPPGMDRFVTWRWNASVSEPEVGEGHYMHRFDLTEEEWVQKAWDDFEERSRTFYQQVPMWFDWERGQTPAPGFCKHNVALEHRCFECAPEGS